MPLARSGPDLRVFSHPFDFEKGPQKVKMGHQEIAGVLRELVVLCWSLPLPSKQSTGLPIASVY
jgi:hypothetical protein